MSRGAASARLTAGAERDARIIPGSAGSGVHEPADWEPGQAVTNLGWPLNAAASGNGCKGHEQPEGLALTPVLTFLSSAFQTNFGWD